MTNIFRNISILLSILLYAQFSYAQCNVDFSLTVTNAGGCGETNGSVYFTLDTGVSANINQAYYEVEKYNADNVTTAPVTPSNNVNNLVALPIGNYRGRVTAQCTTGGNAASGWKNFTVALASGNKPFTVSYEYADSRPYSMIAHPTARITFKLQGYSGGYYTYNIDMLSYPATYTGSLHFVHASTTNQTEPYTINNLPAGNYTFRITNGCQITTVGPIVITNYTTDLPPIDYISSSIRNTMGDGISTSIVATDYKALYIGAYLVNNNAHYHNLRDYYEYALHYSIDGTFNPATATWLPMGNYNFRVPTEYTIKEMSTVPNKTPYFYIRVKDSNPNNNVSKQIQINDYVYQIAPTIVTDESDCSKIYLQYYLGNQGGLTYPLKIIVKDYNDTETLATYSVTKEDLKRPDVNNNFFGTANIYDIEPKNGGFQTYFHCVDTLGYNNDRLFKAARTAYAGIEDSYKVHSTYKLSKALCGTIDKFALTINNESSATRPQDQLRGATIKYVGNIPLPEEMITEYTIPADYTGSVYTPLTASKYNTTPWTNPYKALYLSLDEGEYKWEITLPCGITFIITHTVTHIVGDSSTFAIDESKFNPTITSTGCGYVQISMGSIEELKQIYKNTSGVNQPVTFLTMWYSASSDNFSTSSSFPFYFNDTNYTSYTVSNTSSGADPYIKVGASGTFYLVAIPVNYTIGTIYSEQKDCVVMKEFTISEDDFTNALDADATGAYFCSQDGLSGNIFLYRKENISGTSFKFSVENLNGSETYNETVTTNDLSVMFSSIDVTKYGTEFKVSVEPVGGCITTKSSATIYMSEIGNSSTFIKQNQNADCTGNLNIDIDAVAYSNTGYKWKNAVGTVLSNQSRLSGNFATGTKLYLEVTFSPIVINGVPINCGVWTKEYTVKGVGLTEYYWKKDAISNDWNNPANWNDYRGITASTAPGACSSAYIPGVVDSYFPDASTTSNPTIINLYLEYGAQLYNQHLLNYDNTFVKYNTGYYDVSGSAYTTLQQPAKAINTSTAHTTNKTTIAKNSLPIIDRGRWYMLASPLKGMCAGDFQMGMKPATMLGVYGKKFNSYNVYENSNNLSVLPSSTALLSDFNNAFGLWVVPFANAHGADDHAILETLKGSIQYPYFYPHIANNSILDNRTDVLQTASGMTFDVFHLPLLTASATSANIPRHAKAGRFIYEDDATNAIPANKTYSLTVLPDTQTADGEIMIGNPFMAPIDFYKFYQVNSTAIEGEFCIIVNGQKQTFTAASSVADNLIAPLQSFIVKLKNKGSAATLLFPIEGIVPSSQNSTTVGVRVK